MILIGLSVRLSIAASAAAITATTQFLGLRPLHPRLYYLTVVWRRVLQIASLVCLAGLSLLYPWLESMDPWDSPEPSSDAEIQLIVLLTFVGIMFVLAHLLATFTIAFVWMQVLRLLRQRAGAASRIYGFTFTPLITTSPPIPLRI